MTTTASPVLSISDLCTPPSTGFALKHIQLTAHAGELVVLLGANGAGKSTLLRTIVGEMEATTHHFVRPEQISYLPQERFCAWPLPVREVVALGLLPAQSPNSHHPRVDAALQRCDCLPLADKPINALSGGEQARALLARALASEAPLLLADEPLAALDPAHQLEMLERLQVEAHQHQRAVIVVLHDLALTARFADTVVLLHQGEVLAQGSVEEVMTPALLAQAYQAEFEVELTSTPPRVQILRAKKSREEEG
ncbi:ABC transporter ATP-binding protein [Pokkaliibacter sp. CJK22405]|uniref:ABC transporter ATP-binding protein n=1 Tax=Pokkaliibacter sp. CJK22405 TaxID=3384615 RepID=UPI003984EB5C